MAALQLSNFVDRFGVTHAAAYAKITSYEAGFPPQAQQWCVIDVYADEAAFLASKDSVFTESRALMFNPNSNGAETAAYAQLADAGGIYNGSIVV